MNDYSIFDQNFSDQFNSVDFYANPKYTKITLNIKGKEHLIGNSVVFNTETSNEQIPVYSYNSSFYAKFLKGKKVITGLIALRKVTVDRILSMIKTDSVERDFQDELSRIDESITKLQELMVSGQSSQDDVPKINEYINNKIALRKQIIENKDKYYNEQTDMDLKDDTSDLLWIRDKIENEEISFSLLHESDLSVRVESIKDILFIKKTQDISIDKEDIMEVYQFIGNPISRLS